MTWNTRAIAYDILTTFWWTETSFASSRGAFAPKNRNRLVNHDNMFWNPFWMQYGNPSLVCMGPQETLWFLRTHHFNPLQYGLSNVLHLLPHWNYVWSVGFVFKFMGHCGLWAQACYLLSFPLFQLLFFSGTRTSWYYEGVQPFSWICPSQVWFWTWWVWFSYSVLAITSYS